MALDGFAPPAEEARATASHGLVQRLLAAAQALERRFDESFAAIGLNLTRAEVLAFVARHGSEGCSQTDLAAALRLSESNICTLIERMRADGWLMRMRSSTDRRKSIVMLSPRGLDVIDRLLDCRRVEATSVLRNLELGQLEVLNELLESLLASVASAPSGGANPSTVSLRRAS